MDPWSTLILDPIVFAVYLMIVKNGPIDKDNLFLMPSEATSGDSSVHKLLVCAVILETQLVCFISQVFTIRAALHVSIVHLVVTSC